jgi:hypothetical protein
MTMKISLNEEHAISPLQENRHYSSKPLKWCVMFINGYPIYNALYSIKSTFYYLRLANDEARIRGVGGRGICRVNLLLH